MLKAGTTTDRQPHPTPENNANPTAGQGPRSQDETPTASPLQNDLPSAPTISLPKGGGAIRGIGEKFDVNLATGTGSASVPICISPSRGDFHPQLAITYDSGAGNSAFGLGWNVHLPHISRKTSKGLPRYADHGSTQESDVFLLNGQEDLVPLFKKGSNNEVVLDGAGQPVLDEAVSGNYTIRRYSPRIEKAFDRIERWTSQADPSDIHWRVTSGQNATTILGQSGGSRIADPIKGSGSRTFMWLISEMYDCKGNAMIYEYKSEDSTNVSTFQANEANRSAISRTSNRYIKRIRYGNVTPNRQLDSWTPFSASTLPPESWRFSLVFDYGEHSESFPQPNDQGPWNCRPDPFSTYQPGFEVRTYRLCQRMLMFHHFPELEIPNYLVSSTDLTFAPGPALTYLASAAQSGYILNDTKTGYLKQQLPPVEFGYSTFPSAEELSNVMPQDVDPDSLRNLPIGLDGKTYQWVDLDGEGLSGILTEQGRKWLYKRNRGANTYGDENFDSVEGSPPLRAKFETTEEVLSKPSLPVTDSSAHFGDVSGTGRLDLIQMENGQWGYFERIEDDAGDGGWESFRVFAQFPNIDIKKPGVKFVDLTGDGLADILVCDDQAFSWYPSLGTEGYGPPQVVTQPNTQDAGPVCVFADVEQSIILADMSGDGLTDLVCIRNGNVSYWPSLGYGVFGAMVQMESSPHFDSQDMFDQKYVRLADVDGSGTTDILYFGPNGVDVYLNQAGNSFAREQRVPSPLIDSATTLTVVDLLGNGTGCIVWSTSLPLQQAPAMRYIDLVQGKKPHLLTSMINNLGAERIVQYAPSTKYYLEDEAKGQPWLTKLPFPVHCIEKVEIIDRLNQCRYTSTYSYHHGFYDRSEREFGGFGRVEQIDTDYFAVENVLNMQDPSTVWRVPMQHVKSWFHTGYSNENHNVCARMSNEYFSVSSASNQLMSPLSETVAPDGASASQQRQAHRSLKGQLLRSEVYDTAAGSSTPLRAQESNYTTKPVQTTQDAHGHYIFLVHPRESMSIIFEKDAEDPRLSHDLTLEVDPFGNPRKAVQVSYGRTPSLITLNEPEKSKQQISLVMYTEHDFTNIVADQDYRLPSLCETRQYEITDLNPANSARFTMEELTNGIAPLPEIAYEVRAQQGAQQKRLIKKSRVHFRRDDLSGLLPLGQIGSMALPGIAYDMAFTPGLIAGAFKKKNSNGFFQNLISDPNATFTEAGYVDVDKNGYWWRPTDSIFYSTIPSNTAAEELATARLCFFNPRRAVNAFGASSIYTFDTHGMFPAFIQDAVGNTRTGNTDYRTLKPSLVTDENGNRTAVMYDGLGLVTGTAIMGKVGENLGDSLAGFQSNMSQTTVDQFFASPTAATAVSLLGNATTRVINDPTRYKRDNSSPIYAATISRETHSSDPLPATGLQVQIGFAYQNGLGYHVQTRRFAQPGPLTEGGQVSNPRWVVSDWAISNSKGKPVKNHESFFEGTHKFGYDMAKTVSAINIYDPLMRTVAILQPDHTYGKTIFQPWSEHSYDVCDNVLISDCTNDPDVGYRFKGLPASAYMPSWYDQRINGNKGTHEKAAAIKAASHANTPQVHHLDVLGRPVLTIDDCGNGRYISTRSTLDITGNQLDLVDSLDRVVARYEHNLVGERIHEKSMDSGEGWSLRDVAGNIILSWNNRDHRFRTVYDAIRRPTERWVSNNGAAEILMERIRYGEQNAQASTKNLRTREWQVVDQAGFAEAEYDFKGNVVVRRRQLAQNYKDTLDVAANPSLESQVYVNSTVFDACNRPFQSVAADSSITHRTYDRTGFLYKISVNIRGQQSSGDPTTWTPMVKRTEYNARGQQILIENGNGTITTSTLDPVMFRLMDLRTVRGSDVLQDLSYVDDPAGHVIHMSDGAQQSIYFRNARVDPGSDYTYDALYRLVEATGREHLGQTGGGPSSPTTPGPVDDAVINADSPADGGAMGSYTETYRYNDVGNILSVSHAGNDPNSPGWTRSYSYQGPSYIEAGRNCNRLTSTTVGSVTENYQYDPYGNMVAMPHLSLMNWDQRNQLRATSKQNVSSGNMPETTYYVYNLRGERIRKVTESQATATSSLGPTRRKERLYFAGFEISRKFNAGGDAVLVERTTLSISTDSARVANVELRTQGQDNGLERVIRFQYGNNNGSASLELDETARIISYEEFFPFGSSSYQAVASNVETPKRYRYTGKEKDEESGLYYYGARYYASWLGVWTAPDLAESGRVHPYVYVNNNPINFVDPDGKEEGMGKWTRIIMKNGLGSIVHAIVLPVLATRINMLSGSPIKASFEHETLPGGSKTPGSTNTGFIDLLLDVPTLGLKADETSGHVYDLRAVTDLDGIMAKYDETVHYSKHIIGTTLNGKKIAQAGPGTALETLAKANPRLMAPITLKVGDFEVSISFWLAKNPKTGETVPGVILYKVRARKNGNDKDYEVTEQAEWEYLFLQQGEKAKKLQVYLGSTAEAQAVTGQRLLSVGTIGAAEVGSIGIGVAVVAGLEGSAVGGVAAGGAAAVEAAPTVAAATLPLLTRFAGAVAANSNAIAQVTSAAAAGVVTWVKKKF